jgi:hypothetical protein
MAVSYGIGSNPAYNPATWSLGYQTCQVGTQGPSVLEALANPPANMVTAAENPEFTGGGPDEPFPIYG